MQYNCLLLLPRSKTAANASKKISTATSKGTTKANMIKPASKVPIAKTSQKIETNTTGKSTLNKLATQNGHTINMSTKITPAKSTFANLKEQHPGQRQVFALLSLKRKDIIYFVKVFLKRFLKILLLMLCAQVRAGCLLIILNM